MNKIKIMLRAPKNTKTKFTMRPQNGIKKFDMFASNVEETFNVFRFPLFSLMKTHKFGA